MLFYNSIEFYTIHGSVYIPVRKIIVYTKILSNKLLSVSLYFAYGIQLLHTYCNFFNKLDAVQFHKLVFLNKNLH